jgi:hypothetical protein
MAGKRQADVGGRPRAGNPGIAYAPGEDFSSDAFPPGRWNTHESTVSDTRLLLSVTHGNLLRGVLKTDIRWHGLPAQTGQF